MDSVGRGPAYDEEGEGPPDPRDYMMADLQHFRYAGRRFVDRYQAQVEEWQRRVDANEELTWDDVDESSSLRRNWEHFHEPMGNTAFLDLMRRAQSAYVAWHDVQLPAPPYKHSDELWAQSLMEEFPNYADTMDAVARGELQLP